jgi:hypothetical protein
VNNYYQAITILNTEDSLKFAMEQQGIQDVSEFPRRLAKELEVLQTLSHLPPQDCPVRSLEVGSKSTEHRCED